MWIISEMIFPAGQMADEKPSLPNELFGWSDKSNLTAIKLQ